MEDTGNFYLISHLRLITGLTDRTLRNYLASGLLHGEKINGLWHFSPEEVESFLSHPAVCPSIIAKNHGLVYDFLGDQYKKASETCMILDLPGADRKAVAEFFCYTISQGDFHRFNFSLDTHNSICRIILKGQLNEVMQLVNAFTDKFPSALSH